MYVRNYERTYLIVALKSLRMKVDTGGWGSYLRYLLLREIDRQGGTRTIIALFGLYRCAQ